MKKILFVIALLSVSSCCAKQETLLCCDYYRCVYCNNYYDKDDLEDEYGIEIRERI